MKLYEHSIACAALDDEDERGCTCTESFPSHPTRAEEVRSTAASARVSLPYDAIYVMTKQSIDGLFAADAVVRRREARELRERMEDFLSRYPREIDE